LPENREISDALSGLAFLRVLPEVDGRNVAVIGHSFGGSLTLLLAGRERDVRAVVIFSGARYSWDRSPQLRARLLTAVAHIGAPVFLIHVRTTTRSRRAKRWTRGCSSSVNRIA